MECRTESSVLSPRAELASTETCGIGEPAAWQRGGRRIGQRRARGSPRPGKIARKGEARSFELTTIRQVPLRTPLEGIDDETAVSQSDVCTGASGRVCCGSRRRVEIPRQRLSGPPVGPPAVRGHPSPAHCRPHSDVCPKCAAALQPSWIRSSVVGQYVTCPCGANLTYHEGQLWRESARSAQEGSNPPLAL